MAAWVIVSVAAEPPLTRAVTVPWRSVPAFAPTAYEIVRLFVPAEPVVIAIHDTSAVAVQLHVDAVFIDALYVPPLAGTCCDLGESANEHDPVGVAGDELWPQPTVVKSTSSPTIEVILTSTSSASSEDLRRASMLPSFVGPTASSRVRIIFS